jgi:hypothetical protein
VDGIPRPSRQKLIWRPHSQIILDLALPASHVQVNVATNAGQPRESSSVHLHRIDATGRRWSFSLAKTDSSAAALFISARFAEGDIYAELSLTKP